MLIWGGIILIRGREKGKGIVEMKLSSPWLDNWIASGEYMDCVYNNNILWSDSDEDDVGVLKFAVELLRTGKEKRESLKGSYYCFSASAFSYLISSTYLPDWRWRWRGTIRLRARKSQQQHKSNSST